MHACIEAALDVCLPQIDEKMIAIHTELAATHPAVSGDFPRLNQVLWNLIKNAVKFSPPNGRIEIFTRNEAGRVVVEIRDHGLGDRAGSSGHDLRRIQPRQSRVGGHRSRPRLAITRAIVEGRGGGICAESAGAGQGAVFRGERLRDECGREQKSRNRFRGAPHQAHRLQASRSGGRRNF